MKPTTTGTKYCQETYEETFAQICTAMSILMKTTSTPFVHRGAKSLRIDRVTGVKSSSLSGIQYSTGIHMCSLHDLRLALNSPWPMPFGLRGPLKPLRYKSVTGFYTGSGAVPVFRCLSFVFLSG